MYQEIFPIHLKPMTHEYKTSATLTDHSAC